MHSTKAVEKSKTAETLSRYLISLNILHSCMKKEKCR